MPLAPKAIVCFKGTKWLCYLKLFLKDMNVAAVTTSRNNLYIYFIFGNIQDMTLLSMVMCSESITLQTQKLVATFILILLVLHSLFCLQSSSSVWGLSYQFFYSHEKALIFYKREHKYYLKDGS